MPPRSRGQVAPSVLHTVERHANNPIEADHGRLKARLRPMRGLNLSQRGPWRCSGVSREGTTQQCPSEASSPASPARTPACSRSAISARLRATLAAPCGGISYQLPNRLLAAARTEQLGSGGQFVLIHFHRDGCGHLHAERTIGSPSGTIVCPVGPSCGAVAAPPAEITNRVGRRYPPPVAASA
jgi:hypothetical protein